MNSSGSYAKDVEDVRAKLSCQVTHSVRWEQGIRAMMECGVLFYLEIGCGKTLTGMNKKIGTGGLSISLEKVSELDEAARQVEGFVKGTLCSSS